MYHTWAMAIILAIMAFCVFYLILMVITFATLCLSHSLTNQKWKPIVVPLTNIEGQFLFRKTILKYHSCSINHILTDIFFWRWWYLHTFWQTDVLNFLWSFLKFKTYHSWISVKSCTWFPNTIVGDTVPVFS